MASEALISDVLVFDIEASGKDEAAFSPEFEAGEEPKGVNTRGGVSS